MKPRGHRRRTKIQLRRRRRRLKVAISIVAVLILLVGGSIYLFNRDAWLITEVEVRGAHHLDETAVEQTAAAHLSGTVWGVYPRQNAFLYPKQLIRNDLRVTYPRIRGIRFDLAQGFKKLEITVRERRPMGRRCLTSASSSECMLFDGEGFLYATTSSQTKTDLVFTYTPGSTATGTPYMHRTSTSSNQKLGTSFLPDDFDMLIELIRQVGGLGVTVERVVIAPHGDYHLLLAHGGKLIITLGQPVIETVRNLETLLRHNDLDLRVGEHGNTFEHIDLRFGNRVFYKPRSARAASS